MIEARGISMSFSGVQALSGVTLDVAAGELVALLGPSGSGKTTLLRIIAGLEGPTAGAIHLDGTDITHLSPRERQVGFVFQHYALFRHMTVFDNIAFGLNVRPRRERLPRAAIARKVHELLHLVQLESMAERYPAQLSGGQRQRVALARALAIEPRVLLLDEPFGALDARVRKELRRWLRRLHDEVHITSVFVTHDQEEAMEVADRVVVMHGGVIEQIGAPRDIYDHPQTPFVYEFLGNVNSLSCQVRQGTVALGGQRFRVPEAVGDGEARAFVRPHDVILGTAQSSPAARVRTVAVIGPLARVEIELADGSSLEAEVPRQELEALRLAAGGPIDLSIRRARLFIDRPPAAPVDLVPLVA